MPQLWVIFLGVSTCFFIVMSEHGCVGELASHKKNSLTHSPSSQGTQNPTVVCFVLGFIGPGL